MASNPTLFTITVPVTKKIMDRAIEVSTYELEDYAPEHFRAAGISAKKIRSALANDDGFRSELTKQMVETARQAIWDAFDYSDISVDGCATIKNAIKLLDRAAEADAAKQDRAAEAQRIKAAAALLSKAGFKVVKA